MKFLLVQSTLYMLKKGGANKANQSLIEGLSKAGHRCVSFAPVAVTDKEMFYQFLQQKQLKENLDFHFINKDICVFRLNGVEIYAVLNIREARSYLKALIKDFEPSWILVSSEDPTQALLETALEACPFRVVTIIHTILALPFGPHCAVENPKGLELFRQSAGVICVSEYTRNYCKTWGKFEPDVLHFPVYGQGPFMDYSNFSAGFVMMVNPSAIKGISIFLELAKMCPAVSFAAVPLWATTQGDLDKMRTLPNIHILQPVDDMDELYSKTKVLLMPSLCIETFGQIVIEAMLRGIPVIASNAGGLPEAKLGIPYTLPVNPIQQYQEMLDDKLLPIPIVPEQDIKLWENALYELVNYQSSYKKIADTSRKAAVNYVNNLDINAFEEYFNRLQLLKKTYMLEQPFQLNTIGFTGKNKKKPDGLSKEKLTLLAMRLKER